MFLTDLDRSIQQERLTTRSTLGALIVPAQVHLVDLAAELAGEVDVGHESISVTSRV